MNGQRIYKVKAMCKNCFSMTEQEIPYGKEAYKHLIDKECLTCGCKSVAQIQPPME